MTDSSEDTADPGEDPLTYHDTQCLELVKQYVNLSMDIDDLGTGPCENSTFDLQCLKEYATNQSYLDDGMERCRNVTEDYDPFYFYQTGQLIFLWILLILIVVGNLAVLVALGMSNTRKSRMNYFIKHLALADLSVGLISVLTDIVWKITVSWHAGNIVCKVIRFSQVLVTYSSTYVLVALSIDRYDAICHPMNFSRGWRRARALVAAAWILSAIFSTPMLVLYQEGVIEGQTQCWIDLPEEWHWKLYMTLVSVSLLVLPALLIFACYIVIVRTIWIQSGALTASAPSNTRASSAAGANRDGRMGAPMLDEDQDSRRASSRGIIPRAKIKTVKMTFVIVFVFILCWAPYIVFDLLQVYGHIPKTKTMTAVTTFIQSLAPLNSAANPLIYCLFSTHLCRNLRKIPALEWLATQFECVLRVVFCCPSSSSSSWRCCCSSASSHEGRHSVDQQLHPSNERPNNHHFRRLATKSASDTRTTQLSSTCASQPESVRLIAPLRLKSSRPSVSAKSAGLPASGSASTGTAKSEENGRLHNSKLLEETICEELNVSSTRSEWV